MSKSLTSALRSYMELAEQNGGEVLVKAEELAAIADEIDGQHRQRMWQCEREVRKRLCKDVRWAVNLLEDCATRGWIRRQIEKADDDE